MFTNFFDDEVKCIMDGAVWERDLAYKCYCRAILYLEMFDFDRTILYANYTLGYLHHDGKWSRFVKSDKLRLQAQSLLKVTPSMRDFHKWCFRNGVIKYRG